MGNPNFLKQDALSSSVGFWSGHTILFNETESPVWVSSLSSQEVAALLTVASREALDRFLIQFANNFKSFDLQNATWRKLMLFVQKNCIKGVALFQLIYPDNEKNDLKTVSWSYFLDRLKQTCNTSEDIAQAIESAVEVASSKERVALVANELGLMSGSSAAMARVDWHAWAARLKTPQEMLAAMFEFIDTRQEEMQFRGGPGWTNPSTESTNTRLITLLGELTSNVPITTNEFSYDPTSSLYNCAQCIRGACSAISWAILILCRQNLLYLPLNYYNVRKATFTASEPEFAEIVKHFSMESQTSRIVFQRLNQSTNVQSIEDVSVELCHALIRTSRQLQTAVSPGITASVLRYQVENPNQPKFPIAEINFKRKRARKSDNKDRVATPEWFEETGLAEWAKVAHIYFQGFPGAQDAAKNIIARVFEWTGNIGIASVFDVRAINLVNPLNPNDAQTFCHYLESKYTGNASASIWSGTSRFFKSVFNALKPLPEFDGVSMSNPFDGLSNPFRFNRKRLAISKTFRKLMPADHLEAMLETLLDTDELGEPTFAWAKTRFPTETTELYNYSTNQFEVVWHSARTICLAVLLLIPLRAKQARWLDEGLMDQMRWNLGSDAWEANTHELASYKYGDGQSHAQRYGRNSGILQPVESLLGSNAHHIGLYINTNKTQLWNPEARTGYAIPWPDGSELMSSEDQRVRQQGRRLGLVYSLIRQQMRWVRTYDPNPVPVDFTLDGERYSEMVAGKFPKFTPIFRDMTAPVSDAQGNSVYVPVSRVKLEALYHAVAEETERRLEAKGWPKDAIRLTVRVPTCESVRRAGDKREYLTKCAYDLHSLRVAGITHLLEMGVPAHIVSEFIAGHMALVMTLHYAKFQPLKLRQKIIDAFSESSAIETFEDVLAKRGIGEMSSLLVRNKRFSSEEAPPVEELLDHRGLWRYINGGVCPGGSCSEGGAQLLRKGSEVVQEFSSCPVPGGNEACGNCRFFLTGPAFLVPQMLVANTIMLKMREFGRSRKKLWDEKARLELASFETAKTGLMPTSELSTLTGELERIERALEPLILEWCNRYEMFMASLSMLDKWNKAAKIKDGEHGKLLLFGAGNTSDFSANLDPEGCDFSLVKQIVLQSEMMGGRRMVSGLAEYKLREFVDRILVRKDVRDLMLTISDDSRRKKASLMMADAISVLAGGDSKVQSLLDSDQPLNTTPEQMSVLRELAEAVSNSNGDLDDLRLLEPITLLEHVA